MTKSTPTRRESVGEIADTIEAHGETWGAVQIVRLRESNEALVRALRDLLELCDADASFENRDIESYKYDAIVNDVMGRARAALTLSGAGE